ncbi:hypothetical protein PSQ90_04675 [Devosia rhodophyticola]|uniref:Tripartite tricarboxylate transporter TctB family protein n=1 Tax=Devosia rhodophyticola TaxID=3026423 RepID=A0ABY7YZS1_9HYPH|nr:hypothetical protein [Devosia rhodophyticola]WDR06751.1 hypothetical protein PSQ90_04675 [Devosia rhodophyticola]
MGASRGWLGIIQGQKNWRQHFRLSVAGLLTALIIFGLVALMVTLLSTMGEAISETSIAGSVLVECSGLLALVVTIVGVRLLGRRDLQPLTMIIPGIYAVTAYVLLRSIFAAISGPLAGLALFGLGFLLYGLARQAARLNLIGAVAFAVLTLGLLVAMPASLYMLTIPAHSSI